jgi:hypothetical protein
MNVKYILEGGLFERRKIRSGRIYAKGTAAAKYGVIYTVNKDRTEDDLGLAPELMVGAYLGLRSGAETDTERFFEILGGYFYHDNYPNPGTTTKVFGIALEPELGTTEGGTTTPKDKWRLDDPLRTTLDEAYWSKDGTKYHGWTFIVTLKEGDAYPFSDDELKIFVFCPAIKNIEVTYGSCVAGDNVRRRQVKFEITLEGPEPQRWRWDFGDGATATGAGSPPATIEHLYEKKPAAAPQLCLACRQACGEICQTVELAGFKECLPCPAITDIQYKSLGRDHHTETLEFTAIVSRPPDNVEWDFGDNSPGEKLTIMSVRHAYKIPAQDTSYQVVATGSGPEDCQCRQAKNITITALEKVKIFCFWLQVIIAFLAATTVGTGIIYLVGKIYNQITDFSWVIDLLILQLILLGLGIFLWYRFAKRRQCAAPNGCAWLKIGWVAAFAGLLNAFYVQNCCGAGWWLVILILLGLTGYLFITWVRKCKVRMKDYITYFLVCFLAVACVYYFVARPFLADCL